MIHHLHTTPSAQEKSQIQNLISHLKELETEQQRNPKTSRKREIIKIRAEINNLEYKTKNKTKTTTKTVEQMNLRASFLKE